MNAPDPKPDDTLRSVAEQFVTYWTTEDHAGGCGMCGGVPHSTTCFVGRMQAMLRREPDASWTLRAELAERIAPGKWKGVPD